jgi:hypothetical protein
MTISEGLHRIFSRARPASSTSKPKTLGAFETLGNPPTMPRRVTIIPRHPDPGGNISATHSPTPIQKVLGRRPRDHLGSKWRFLDLPILHRQENFEHGQLRETLVEALSFRHSISSIVLPSTWSRGLERRILGFAGMAPVREPYWGWSMRRATQSGRVGSPHQSLAQHANEWLPMSNGHRPSCP